MDTFESPGSTMFGTVPSQVEVERAIAALQGFLSRISSCGSDINWVRLLGSCDPRMIISDGLRRAAYAFHLLQYDPSMKRLVISLCSDRAIWEAILNNEAARNLRASLSSENGMSKISNEAGAKPDLGLDIFSWILELVKEKILELIKKFSSLVDEIFEQRSDSMKQTTAETAALLQEKVQSSLLLSVVILLIIVLARVQGA